MFHTECSSRNEEFPLRSNLVSFTVEFRSQILAQSTKETAKHMENKEESFQLYMRAA